MSAKKLPGFLRRSLRHNFDEEEDEEENVEDVLQEQQENGDREVLEVPVPSPALQNSKAAENKASTTTTTVTSTGNKKEESLVLANTATATSNNNDQDPSAKTTKPSYKLSDSWQDIPDTPPVSGNHNNSNNNDHYLLSDQARALIIIGAEEAPRPSWRDVQFQKCLQSDIINLQELRKLGWNGIPKTIRALSWKILLGYVPTNEQRRAQTLQRKRSEYKDAMSQHYDIDDDTRTLQEQETLRQVIVDVPRTAPDIPLFRNDRIKRVLTRLLYIWAMRHPASSYVQGINDLATPFIIVFLADYFEGQDVLDGHVMNHLGEDRLEELEADVYWCLSNLLAGIQDHYTADQPGVQRMVKRLEDLVQRIDGNLCQHLRDEGVQFLQFSFKWMNCLLLREFHLRCIPRLWDTYLSEKNGFEDFHVYVCAAFLCQFSTQLQGMSFDELFGFFQQIPTTSWSEMEIEMLLSQAYVLSTLFGGSDAHLANSSNHNNAR